MAVVKPEGCAVAEWLTHLTCFGCWTPLDRPAGLVFLFISSSQFVTPTFLESADYKRHPLLTSHSGFCPSLSVRSTIV